MRNCLAIILLTFVFFECKSPAEHPIVGSWTIDQLYCNDESVGIGVNVIHFQNDGVCKIPPLFGDTSPAYHQAKWESGEDGKSVRINSNLECFSGQFQVNFFTDPITKTERMELLSNKSKIVASKWD